MAIDPSFEDTYEEVDQHEDHRVWTTDGEEPTEEKQGIHGTHVAVDFDICIADGACLEDCPVDVFEGVDTPGHPESEIKADPIHEDQCIDCMLCVDVCPVDAIDVDPGRAGRLVTVLSSLSSHTQLFELVKSSVTRTIHGGEVSSGVRFHLRMGVWMSTGRNSSGMLQVSPIR